MLPPRFLPRSFLVLGYSGGLSFQEWANFKEQEMSTPPPPILTCSPELVSGGSPLSVSSGTSCNVPPSAGSLHCQKQRLSWKALCLVRPLLLPMYLQMLAGDLWVEDKGERRKS